MPPIDSRDSALSGIDAKRVEDLYQTEFDRFIRERPLSRQRYERARRSMPGGVPMAWMIGLYDHPPLFVLDGEGAYFTDIDGHRYLDMNHADMSMSCGFAPKPIVDAVAEQASKGTQFLLPTDLAIEVSELLADRFGLPYWQYTLSASTANTEAIRLSRLATGRRRLLTFDGNYQGHIDYTLGAQSVDDLPPGRWPDSVKVQYNDLEAAERVLRDDSIACVIVEPAITNINLVRPDPGFHKALRDLAHRHGALIVMDETHTHVCAWGGLTRAWELDPDIVVMGKAIAGGVPLGVYGMTESLAQQMDAEREQSYWPSTESGALAVGGTLYGNPLSLAASRAALTEILTPEGHARTAELGGVLADGIERIVRDVGLPWSAHRLYCRTGVCYAPEAPRNAIEASRAANFEINRLHRIFLANRGIWEAILSAGPAVSFAAEREDIEKYLATFEELTQAIVA